MNRKDRVSLSVMATIACMALQSSGCDGPTEHRSDPSAGVNGGFEVVRDGMPVNWLLYTPNRTRASQFRMTLDTVVFKEGRQSLKFELERVGPGTRPGFTNEFSDVGRFRGPARYRVSFWAKSDSTTFVMSSGPVSTKAGNMRPVVTRDALFVEWTEFEFVVDVPKEQWLRLRLSLLSPGSFWIDDVRIARVD